jgi:hypothetical protein
MPPEPLSKSVHIPVQKKGHNLEFLFGGPLPEIKDGTTGFLIVPLEALGEDDRAAFEAIHTEPLLPADTHLWVQVQATVFADELLIPSPDMVTVPIEGAFAEVILQEDLTILLRGTKRPILSSCPCFIPKLNVLARSLNHAYSLISERYEPHRASHTGNVFQKVFYKSEEGIWRPLESLRRAAQNTENERLVDGRKKNSAETSWIIRVANRLKG